ncbi:Aste57867_9893 [Aphanomyces stellatus]|uniref:Aste57867_9893 protein n=1 Tax=Aphanomyces stellatus TaxID=120398 RepID=A0A485KP10_9STRA|nr:hypothetical protein As57867_009854 [Aphanomyces stellatus]VFT86772.1 Aste57867_9893 [Aphanomyces stellatus]
MLRLLPILAACLASTSAAALHPFGAAGGITLNDMLLGHTDDRSDDSSDRSVDIPNDLWFTNQSLDHTSSTNLKTWKQRYHVNTDWFGGANAPIFLFVNGESPADATTVTSSTVFMNELAQTYQAMVVSVEHRFYGLSQPTGDLSIDSLKFLTMEQALLDLTRFQSYFVGLHNLTKTNKWVAFGGSYPGMLAGFLVSKFPDRFAGAVASSAPVNMKTDFHEYKDTVAKGLRAVGGDACAMSVGQAILSFHALVASSAADDQALLKKLFNPCDGPVTNDWHRATLELIASNIFGSYAQYNGLSKYGLKDVCVLFNTSRTPLDGLASLARTIWSPKGSFANCTLSNYDSYAVDGYLSTSVVNPNATWRQWMYQTCAEFGFAQLSATAKSFFGVLKYGTLDATHYTMCRRLFGINDTEANTATTRQVYGGLKVNTSNVVWVNGNLDPWSALSFTNDTKPVNLNSDVVYIDGTAHCADMRSRSLKPVPAWAHDRIERNVRKFLGL